MRLVTYLGEQGPQAGVLTDEGVVSAAEILGRDEPIADVQALLLFVPHAVDRLHEALDFPRAFATRKTQRLDSVRLLPPVLRPPTIRDHVAFEEHSSRQFTRPVPDVWRRQPIHYYSNTSRLVGADAPVAVPETERLDYELEVAAVIGKQVSDLEEDDWLDAVVGFLILNDWSARDLQADEMTYGLGPAKGKDFATSLGPWLVTTDEVAPALHDGVLHLRCRVRVNGAIWADSSTAHQYHTWGAILEHAAQDSTLLPGDVIASGTVGGCSVGEAIRKGFPARYLQPGDRVELEVERLGTLANAIVGNQRGRPARYRAAAVPPMPQPLAAPPP